MERRATEGAVRARRAAAAAALAVAACVPANGPLMNPGEDCLSCHGGQTRARTWTVAGTLYGDPYVAGSSGLRGAHVQITDANGWSFSLRTNQVGNFYTAEGVAFPLRVCAERSGVTSCMVEPVASGSCNVCHGPEGAASGGEGHLRFFPIAAGTSHAEVSCAECHGGAVRAVAELRCASCHLSLDPTLEPRHTSSTLTSDPSVTVSPSEFALESAVCVRCHGDGQVNRTADHPSGEGTPPHRGATCLVCHDVYRADKPWAADFATPPASWPPGSGHGCVRCHTGGVPTGG